MQTDQTPPITSQPRAATMPWKRWLGLCARPACRPGEVTRAVADSRKRNGGANGHSPSKPDAPAPVALSENARVILEQRYLRKDDDGKPTETPEGLFRRVAQAIAEGEDEPDRQQWEERFYHLLASLRFLPNSPTLVNAGTGRGCLSACFVVSPEDNMRSIMQVATDAAMIEKWGGGIGFGLSKLRPKSDKISTTHGESCGPIAVMKLYSAVGATLTQGAFRLGAHMGQLRDSHPDIREFIHCKDGDDTLQNFNISVQITDEFMRAVEEDREWGARQSPRRGRRPYQRSGRHGPRPGAVGGDRRVGLEDGRSGRRLHGQGVGDRAKSPAWPDRDVKPLWRGVPGGPRQLLSGLDKPRQARG